MSTRIRVAIGSIATNPHYLCRRDRRRSALCPAVRRAELAAADAQQTQARQAAEARRKRVRRIEEGKEDREALREFARSRDDGTCLELEATPAGVRRPA